MLIQLRLINYIFIKVYQQATHWMLLAPLVFVASLSFYILQYRAEWTDAAVSPDSTPTKMNRKWTFFLRFNGRLHLSLPSLVSNPPQDSFFRSQVIKKTKKTGPILWQHVVEFMCFVFYVCMCLRRLLKDVASSRSVIQTVGNTDQKAEMVSTLITTAGSQRASLKMNGIYCIFHQHVHIIVWKWRW